MRIRLQATLSLALFTLLVLASSPAWAQSPGDQLQTRDKIQDKIQDPLQTRDQLYSHYMDRVNEYDSTSDQQRDRLRQNLKDCLVLDLPQDQLDTLFPVQRARYSTQAQLKMQNAVLALAREGMPTDLLCGKIAEGTMKNAPESALEGAVARMEGFTKHAHQYLNQARQEGFEGAGDFQIQRQLERGVALNMWRGLQEGELDQLRDRAKDRLRDGSCSLVDLAAASETATELKELGVSSDRALGLCGDALQQGYRGQEMRQIGHMFMAAHMNGENDEQLCDALQMRIRQREQLGQMMEYMQGQGWMGPEQMGHDYGGGSPVDEVMGGGHHGDGMNGDGSGSGMGGDGSGGGSGGGMGGGGN
jgi:hypothetical protein